MIIMIIFIILYLLFKLESYLYIPFPISYEETKNKVVYQKFSMQPTLHAYFLVNC